MAVTLAGFKAYARLGADCDDTDAQLFLDAAQEHAREAGIPTDRLTNSPKYALFIYATALQAYDNRGFSPASQAYSYNEYMRQQTIKMRRELMLMAGEEPPTEE